ncbi:hypothetical protein [Roseivirga spongicola]|uniref:hypothetical protein n=1 Tax=Roseivirga spongicola TaxID=333140 RepID=UPI002AC99B4E|nr:hypothetical protein [Roseivirga spongicola]WPZ09072.1 hypothetical protein T7867_12475 [Roseivirga spongicola]
MEPKSIFLKRPEVTKVVTNLREAEMQLSYDFEKHKYSWEEQGMEFSFRLPITIFSNEEGVVELDREVTYLMLLVQSGSASVGVFQHEKCLSHKVFSSYMVRKKQGKSQIKHLKTKGKSRAGSRIRLASGAEMFDNVNERLQRHFQEHDFDRITFSCSKILFPHLFGAKVEPPFDKKDPKIYKIPKHLHQPNFEVMLGMQRFLNLGELIIPQEVNEEDLFYLR